MRLGAFAALISAICTLNAMPITYTWQTTATGTLGSVAFDSALVTITTTGDTDNVALHVISFYNVVDNPTVTISSIGTTTIIAATGRFTGTATTFMVFAGPVGTPTGTAGVGFGPIFSINPPEIGGIVLTSLDSAFSRYDLTTPFGPITGMTGAFIVSETTLGTLWFNTSINNRVTFTATTAAPEPMTLLIMAGGLALIVAGKRKVSA